MSDPVVNGGSLMVLLLSRRQGEKSFIRKAFGKANFQTGSVDFTRDPQIGPLIYANNTTRRWGS